MAKRQRKVRSSIDRLDSGIKSRIDALLKDGRLTLDEILDQINAAFPAAEIPSRSALGRYSQRFEDVGRRMRESREVARVWAERLGQEPQGDIGKLVMELLRTMAFDATLALSEPGEDGQVQLDPKAINTLSLAMQRLEAAGKWNIQREQAMREAVLAQAAETVEKVGKSRGLTDDAIDQFRREILGIVDEPARA